VTTLIDVNPSAPQLSSSPTPAAHVEAEPHWPLATRLVFRLCFVYFGLYVLTTQMLSGMLRLPVISLPSLGTAPGFRHLFIWSGTHLFGIARPIAFQATGSGDKTYDWVQSFTLIVIALIATVAWSVRSRQVGHTRLYRWFRLFIRFALGTTFLGYGLAKVVPLQMPILSLTRLVEPFGDFSPMGVLWYSIGAAPAYEIFVGCAEVLAALLLFVPRTALLGALVALMDATAVFALNMTYDVPVKLFSFHLILLSLFLLAPNARRLYELFVLHQPARIVGEPPLGSDEGRKRLWRDMQLSFAAYALMVGVYGSVQAWTMYGGGARPSPLFGIWEVAQMSIDGQEHPPLLTDSARVRRAIIQFPFAITFQGMDDRFSHYRAVIDTTARTLQLTSSDAAHTTSSLEYQRPTRHRLVLDGVIRGRTVHMEMNYRDPDSFLVRSRGFHWVSEVPFNR
jgi:hypothetical protein